MKKILLLFGLTLLIFLSSCTTTSYNDDLLCPQGEFFKGYKNEGNNTLAVCESVDIPDVTNYYNISESNNTFQPKLVSGSNIKTINSESILGSGNIEITTSSGSNLWSSSGSDIFYEDGNVGIGTNNPQELLQVEDGVIIVRSTQGSNSIESRTKNYGNTITYGGVLSTELSGRLLGNSGGGYVIQGFSNDSDKPAFRMQGHGHTTNPREFPFIMESFRSDAGDRRQPLAGNQPAYAFYNGAYDATGFTVLEIYGDGDTNLFGDLQVDGTISADAYNSNSPHRFLADEDVGYTQICMVASNGEDVVKTIEYKNDSYVEVIKPDIDNICEI